MNNAVTILVSVQTYNDIITNKSNIVDSIKEKDLYYGHVIRSISSIEDNFALTYDKDGKFIDKVKLYDL